MNGKNKKSNLDYETVRLDTRRSKAKLVWASNGWTVPVYAKNKKHGVHVVPGQSVCMRTRAYSVPLGFEYVEAIVVDGVPVYSYQAKSDAYISLHPTTAPLVGGGRFRFARTYSDRQPVMRTLYLYDLPETVGKKHDVRVVFSWTKKWSPDREKEE